MKTSQAYQESNMVKLLEVLSPEEDSHAYIKVVHESLEKIKFCNSNQLKEIAENVRAAYAGLSQEERYELDDKYGNALGRTMEKLELVIAEEDADTYVSNLLSEYEPVEYEKSLQRDTFSPADSESFRAYCTQTVTIKENKLKVAAPDENVSLYDGDSWDDSELYYFKEVLNGDWYKQESQKAEMAPAVNLVVPTVTLKKDSAKNSKKSTSLKNKALKAVAAAAVSFTGTIAALFGYNALKNNDVASHQDYHGSPSVEVVAPPRELKQPSEAGNVTLEEIVIEVAEKPLPRKFVPAPQKIVEEQEDIYLEFEEIPAEDIYWGLEQSKDIYEGLGQQPKEDIYWQFEQPKEDIYWSLDNPEFDYHVPHQIKKGDTIVKLWQEYFSNGGYLSFDEYLKEIKKQNPQLKNPDKIFAGETLAVPSLD